MANPELIDTARDAFLILWWRRFAGRGRGDGVFWCYRYVITAILFLLSARAASGVACFDFENSYDRMRPCVVRKVGFSYELFFADF